MSPFQYQARSYCTSPPYPRSEKVGEYISEAMEKVGKDGVITIEESRGMETELEVVEGVQFDRGYLSQYMV